MLQRATQLYGGAAPVVPFNSFNRTLEQGTGFNSEANPSGSRNQNQFGSTSNLDQFGGRNLDQFGGRNLDQFGGRSQGDQFGRNNQDQSSRNVGQSLNALQGEPGPSVENFRLFQSAPKYGIHSNLLFQVSCPLCCLFFKIFVNTTNCYFVGIEDRLS